MTPSSPPERGWSAENRTQAEQAPTGRRRCVAGTEAGGHGPRSPDLGTKEIDLMPRGELISSSRRRGIADGRGYTAALMLAPPGVLVGTRFTPRSKLLHTAGRGTRWRPHGRRHVPHRYLRSAASAAGHTMRSNALTDQFEDVDILHREEAMAEYWLVEPLLRVTDRQCHRRSSRKTVMPSCSRRCDNRYGATSSETRPRYAP